ncbi:t-SNARE coiled-coil homology domain-containing protein [Chloropicon roscoffensis]|uniref:t-SNARE coiled-coil homology domain-containing protein n=1 Tax=Chloropicon roscoffensis TaxID=1461544 RepID=A0AAX4PI20_9CHLO
MRPVVLPEDDVRMNEDDRKDLDAAKVKNRETTEAARRALQVARETQEVAEHTLAALDSQNQKIRRLDGKMVEMKEDVKRSENYLRYITRTCVCFNCFVTDPTTKEEGKWSEEAKAKQKAEKKVKAKKPVAAAGKGADLQRRDSGTAQKLKIVGDGQPAPLMVAEAAELKEVQADFAEQDAAMDEISGVVGSLGEMSRALGEEIAKQNALLDEVDSKATPLKDRIREMNTRTRLSKMQIKKKESGGSIINDVGSTLIKKSLN